MGSPPTMLSFSIPSLLSEVRIASIDSEEMISLLLFWRVQNLHE